MMQLVIIHVSFVDQLANHKVSEQSNSFHQWLQTLVGVRNFLLQSIKNTSTSADMLLVGRML